ncbi:reverse transcriptase domain protein [Colletotrichum musicola]|uniref:Reverse transcriptase domain protein n=1 Tax=Colletotrichum musicola TaxID=2175873 RepID=A0A8H6ILZ3_9PEZI|nr:reverse transcriptase domain protein [Colletotrichum musicola]
MHRRLIHAHVSRVVEACRRIGITFPRLEIEAFHCEACYLAKSTEIISRDKPLPLTQISEEIYVDVIEKVFYDPHFAHTRLDPTTTYTPSINGSVERAGRTIVEAARTQLIESGLGEDLWDYSIDSTIQILNLLPSISKGKLSPHEIIARELNLDVDRETPRIMHLRTWGCVAYVHRKGPNRPLRSSKIEARAMKGYLVGYDSLRGHIYYVYVPEEDKVFRCRDVRFHEEPGKTVLNLLAKEPLRSDETDFRDPDDTDPTDEAMAEAETTTQGRSRRAATIKDPGYYRLAHRVRSYNKKAFLVADVAVA